MTTKRFTTIMTDTIDYGLGQHPKERIRKMLLVGRRHNINFQLSRKAAIKDEKTGERIVLTADKECLFINPDKLPDREAFWGEVGI